MSLIQAKHFDTKDILQLFYYFRLVKNKILSYNLHLKDNVKKLRNNSTLSEVLLWNKLKGKQLCGVDFHRQKPIGNYIVDFYCPELMLAIEIDGISHAFREEEDKIRQTKLEELGIRFLRFDDHAVKFDMDNVLRCIEEFIQANK